MNSPTIDSNAQTAAEFQRGYKVGFVDGVTACENRITELKNAPPAMGVRSLEI